MRRTKASEAAALLGRKGGAVPSERRAEMARLNGRLGGRPRKDGSPLERVEDPILAFTARTEIVRLGKFVQIFENKLKPRELARIQAAILSLEEIAKRSDPAR